MSPEMNTTFRYLSEAFLIIANTMSTKSFRRLSDRFLLQIVSFPFNMTNHWGCALCSRKTVIGRRRKKGEGCGCSLMGLYPIGNDGALSIAMTKEDPTTTANADFVVAVLTDLAIQADYKFAIFCRLLYVEYGRIL